MVKLVGILNITPDSFSDGGKYNSTHQALAQGKLLIKQGANIIDIGAESTRPGATPLAAPTEWERLEPILAPLIQLAHKHHCLVSVDTYHPQNAQRALTLGADWINDVSGLTDPAMIALARQTTATFVVMHHLGIPASADHIIPDDQHPVDHVQKWITQTLQRLADERIDLSRIILDPGIGFGKNAVQSVQLIEQMERLVQTGGKVLVGHSRKSFLHLLYPTLSKMRDQETLEISKLLIQKGVAFLRVHDIALHKSLVSNFS